MKEFLLLFRADFASMDQPTPEQLEASKKSWIDWITTMAQQGQLADRGRQLDRGGKVVKAGNLITNGPYTEIKETLGGFSVIKAADYDSAVQIAQGCPVLYIGGSVEVRELAAPAQ